MQRSLGTVRGFGACLEGTGAEIVGVEARFEAADRERTEILITGLPDPVIRESKGRVASALEEAGIRLAPGRLHLNLVPAAKRKRGEILDLPLALCAAAAGGHLAPRLLERTLFLGELGIDGRLHAVPGGLAAALAARQAGLARLIAPPETAREAACLAEIEIHGARELAEVLGTLVGREPTAQRFRPPDSTPHEDEAWRARQCAAFDAIRGQGAAKEALAVAAAGGHGLLFVGPPGTGKSMLARALPALLPMLEFEERLEVTRVLSAAGLWPGGLARGRPFRAPHHTTSTPGLVGGGPLARPGELTLAHRGVLFLDELPEFRRETLEALRQPLETGTVLVARAAARVELPARVQLVCAMNPCPCGWRGHPRLACRCPPAAVERYLRRISGPLLDRIDLRLEVPPPRLDELAGDGTAVMPAPGARAAALRERVEGARAVQRARRQGGPNAELRAEDLDALAPLSGAARELVARAVRGRALSARAVQSLRRVARTLADMDGGEPPCTAHFARALALRAPL